VAAALVPLLPDVGSWDLILTGLIAGGGILVGATRATSREVGTGLVLAAASVCAVFAVAEIVVRAVGREPPAFQPPSDARLTFVPAEREWACRRMYAGSGAGDIETGLAVAPDGRPSAVHLGDSMVHNTDVEGGDPFPVVLGRLQPDVTHVPVSVAGTGTDAQYLIARAVLGDRPVDLLVLYVFVGNDLEDMDRSYACCPGGPILAYDETRVAGPRCEEPEWEFPVRPLFARSPPPYPLRVATAFSWLARRACDAFSRATLTMEGPLGLGGAVYGTEAQWAHFEASLVAIRDFLDRRGTSFLVVIFPFRQSIESADPDATPGGRVRDRVAGVLERLRIRTMDATPVVARAVAESPGARFFANQTDDDAHFSPHGHDVIARWLAPTLAQILDARPNTQRVHE
jgi:hypothetical protein